MVVESNIFSKHPRINSGLFFVVLLLVGFPSVGNADFFRTPHEPVKIAPKGYCACFDDDNGLYVSCSELAAKKRLERLSYDLVQCIPLMVPPDEEHDDFIVRLNRAAQIPDGEAVKYTCILRDGYQNGCEMVDIFKSFLYPSGRQ